MNQEEYIKDKFQEHFGSLDNYDKARTEFYRIPYFKPNGNVQDVVKDGISEEAHFIMRTTTGYYLHQAFQAMRIDMNDPNVSDKEKGNIGTPQRIAKVFCGGSANDDTELGGGRWAKKPRIAGFPNTGNKTIPITKRVDIISNCSHHFISFNTLAREDSYAVISYIPEKKVLGISKLQRVTNWVSQRFFLQEDLTKMLYEEISKVAETDSVYVGLYNLTHGCEQLRGSRSIDGAFTSEYYGGKFEDINLRNSVKAK